MENQKTELAEVAEVETEVSEVSEVTSVADEATDERFAAGLARIKQLKELAGHFEVPESVVLDAIADGDDDKQFAARIRRELFGDRSPAVGSPEVKPDWSHDGEIEKQSLFSVYKQEALAAGKSLEEAMTIAKMKVNDGMKPSIKTHVTRVQ